MPNGVNQKVQRSWGIGRMENKLTKIYHTKNMQQNDRNKKTFLIIMWAQFNKNYTHIVGQG